MKLKRIIGLGVLSMLLVSSSLGTFSYGLDNNTSKGVGSGDILIGENDDITVASTKISKITYNNSSNVILSGRNATPDLLSSAPLSGFLKSPVLINSGDSLRPEIIKEIERLKAKNIFVISGEHIVKKSIKKSLKDRGLNIVDLSSEDRFKTSDRIAKYIIDNNASCDKSILINGINYADSPSISAFAYRYTTPILLTNGKSLNDDTLKIIKNKQNVLLVGGEKSISKKMENSLQDMLIKTGRLQGKDRYQTSENIVESLFEYNNKLLVADGNSDIDLGIISAGYSSNNYRPLLLIKNNIKSDSLLKDRDKIYLSKKAFNDDKFK